MEATNILNFKNCWEFREWLEKNHSTQKECWVNCKRVKPEKGVFSHIDAVYAALCYGWIDSTYGLIDGARMQRFSPRKKNSHWSELNKERCRWLIKKGLMTSDGFKILPDLDEEFVIDDDIITALKKDSEVWKNFLDFPDLYKRIKISNIQKERKNEENFKKKLNYFIKNTKSGKTLGNWDDYGRLA
ncbi:YdeI family protein [uncultured Methanobrevibacter sp.]|uniref:YdeI/OmpD-associated family protein n=1 Tax=uncultured Methanobrevibacter sp. TaxID=253161 RepID=UPI0025E2EFA2|nr:YdeI/OmpD-associated family protein [uncultured Methanobrevibacter sp.]